MLAKRLYQQGSTACANQLDHFEFSKGLLSLQDSIELALGAVGSVVEADFTMRMSFHDYFQKINAKLDKNAGLPYVRELARLNDARVQIKHFGIIQKPTDHAQAIGAVRPFLEYVCSTFLKREFIKLSLSDMIALAGLRDIIKAAESALEKNTPEGRRDCVECLATAKYVLFDNEFDRSADVSSGEDSGLGSLGTSVVQSTPYVEQEVRVLALGLNVANFRQLSVILPQGRLDQEKDKIDFQWNEEYCHEGNWTDENLRWAIDFVTDMAVRASSRESTPRILTASEYFDFTISPKGEEALIYDSLTQSLISIPFNTMTGQSVGQPRWGGIVERGQAPVLTLTRGKSITGVVKLHWDKSWYHITSSEIPKGEGFVSVKSVVVEKSPKSSKTQGKI